VFGELRPHVVSLGNDGALRTSGTYGTSRRDVERLVRDDLPALTAGWDAARPRRVLLYAHGGLVPEESALQRVAEYRAAVLGAEVYPVGLVWRSDFWSTVGNVLATRRAAGAPRACSTPARTSCSTGWTTCSSRWRAWRAGAWRGAS
jgi:hypothetical protein